MGYVRERPEQQDPFDFDFVHIANDGPMVNYDYYEYEAPNGLPGWMIAGFAGVAIGFLPVIANLALGGREAQYAAELEAELGEQDLDFVDKVADKQINEAKRVAKSVAAQREVHRFVKELNAEMRAMDDGSAEAQALKQKHAVQEKWDAKKAKWMRKVAAATEAVELDVEMAAEVGEPGDM
jgi:hypothetical protein